MNISDEEFIDLTNNHALMGQIMDEENVFGCERYEFGYQNINNIAILLDDEDFRELNQMILSGISYELCKS